MLYIHYPPLIEHLRFYFVLISVYYNETYSKVGIDNKSSAATHKSSRLPRGEVYILAEETILTLYVLVTEPVTSEKGEIGLIV